MACLVSRLTTYSFIDEDKSVWHFLVFLVSCIILFHSFYKIHSFKGQPSVSMEHCLLDNCCYVSYCIYCLLYCTLVLDMECMFCCMLFFVFILSFVFIIDGICFKLSPLTPICKLLKKLSTEVCKTEIHVYINRIMDFGGIWCLFVSI